MKRRYLLPVSAMVTMMVIMATAVWPDHLATPQATEKSASSSQTKEDTSRGYHRHEVSAQQREMAVAYAATQIGKPYVSSPPGATPPSSWDCSKLTWYAFMLAGVNWDYSMALSYLQWRPGWYGAPEWTVPVPAGKEKPGDLVFFDWYANSSDAPRGLTGKRGVDHVGIVEDPERGTMIEAANPSAGVVRSSYKQGANAARIIGFSRVLARPAS